MAKPFLSVALCTHNHADRLDRTLADLGKLESPNRPWELIVIDNGCTDNTSALLASAEWHPAGAEVCIVREDRLGLSNARNRAVFEARGEYVLFFDDDETPDPAWLKAHEAAMIEYQPDATGGRIEVMFEGNRPPWLADELLGFLGQLNHGEADWLKQASTPFYGGNFAIRRGLTDDVGLFDTALGRRGATNNGGEDTEFYRRLIEAGHWIRWVPEAIINHRIQTSKLRRNYFLDLHFRQGRTEGARKRDRQSRLPPKYLIPQVLRAYGLALGKRLKQGANHSLRLEMNAAYFTGYIMGWALDDRKHGIP